MHKVLGRIFRYVLRLILIAIVLLLFVGLAKNNRDVPGYIQTLNQKSRSEAWQNGGISGIFRGDMGGSGASATATTGDMVITGTSTTEDSGSSTGIDAFDPSLEQDLNQASQNDLNSGDYSDAETGGFINPDASTSNPATGSVSTGDSKSQQLLDLVKQREMNK